MARRSTIIYGILFATVMLTAPAVFLWARTMVYWWLSPDDSPMAKGTVVSQLIDSANNLQSRSNYYPWRHQTVFTPHCDEIEAVAPEHWTEEQRKLMNDEAFTRQLTLSDFDDKAAEGNNLSKSYSVNQMALLVACMEATPFGENCRKEVNEVRWDHRRSEQTLIKYGSLSKLNGEVCITYPEIKFKSQDQQ